MISRVDPRCWKVCDFGHNLEARSHDHVIRQYALIPVVLNRPTADSQKCRDFFIRQKADVAEYRMMALPYKGNGIERLSCPVACLYYPWVVAVYNLVSHLWIIFALLRDARHSREPPGKGISLRCLHPLQIRSCRCCGWIAGLTVLFSKTRRLPRLKAFIRAFYVGFFRRGYFSFRLEVVVVQGSG